MIANGDYQFTCLVSTDGVPVPMPYNFFFVDQTIYGQICILSQSNLSIFLFENILRLK